MSLTTKIPQRRFFDRCGISRIINIDQMVLEDAAASAAATEAATAAEAAAAEATTTESAATETTTASTAAAATRVSGHEVEGCYIPNLREERNGCDTNITTIRGNNCQPAQRSTLGQDRDFRSETDTTGPAKRIAASSDIQSLLHFTPQFGLSLLLIGIVWVDELPQNLTLDITLDIS
jgi:hypothetical protein